MNIIFSNLDKNSKIKKSRAINKKYFEKNRKLIHFLEVSSRDYEEKWWIFGRNTVSLWERWIEKTMNNQSERGKTEKFFFFFFFFYFFLFLKKQSLKRKTHDFCDWNESRTSRQTKPPKTPETKIEKFVQVFFVTGMSTHEEVVKGAEKPSK